MRNDGLSGGFLLTICGRFGSNGSYGESTAPNHCKQNSKDKRVSFGLKSEYIHKLVYSQVGVSILKANRLTSGAFF
jgi:hypothetical protein